MSENEYPKAVKSMGGDWGVEWGLGALKNISWMPDEATARRCAASAKMLEALHDISVDSHDIWAVEKADDAISAATGGE